MKADLKIYTKTGDQGITRLVDGRECSKSSIRVEAYGTVDELNSVLGLTLNSLNSKAKDLLPQLILEVEKVQNQLFNLGSHLACEKAETRKLLPPLEESWIESLENSIDQMTATLAPLKEFILPGGSEAGAYFHLARTVCRRAERLVVRILEEGHQEIENQRALRYLNRLSDYLFVASRFTNQTLQYPDQIWKKT